MKVDLPAFGMPSIPTSANSISSSCRSRLSPGTHGFLTRRTVNGRFETGVAQTVPAAFRHHQTLTVFGHIAHGLAGALIDNPGADRHFYRHVFTALTGTVAALTILPTFGAERFFKTVVDQGVQVLVRFQPDIAAIAAIAAIRTAFRIYFRGGSLRNHCRRHLLRPGSLLHLQTSFYSP